MKNVTTTNGEIAKWTLGVVLGIMLIGYAVGQVELSKESAGVQSVAIDTSSQLATIFVPHHMRGIYYTGDDCDKTAAHEVYIGMPEAQIVCQTGNPEKVNSSTNQYGSRAQYVFSGLAGDRWYLYVTNGKVSSWHEGWTK